MWVLVIASKGRNFGLNISFFFRRSSVVIRLFSFCFVGYFVLVTPALQCIEKYTLKKEKTCADFVALVTAGTEKCDDGNKPKVGTETCDDCTKDDCCERTLLLIGGPANM